MDKYTILCTELRGSAQSLNGNVEDLQGKAEKIQKAINKVTRGDYKTSDLSAAYSAKRALSGSITRLGEICGAMTGAASLFAESSAELSGRANLTAYYMQHTDTLSYEGLMGTYSSAISSAGGAVAGYELVKSTLAENGYAVGSLGSVSNAVQDAMQKEAEEAAKRAEEAKWAKIGLTALVVVGGIALSAVTGGAAAPIVIGAISGAVMAGGSTAIDEYAEHGWDMDKWDYAEIGKDAFVGGVTGAVTAYIGGNVTKGVTNFAAKSQLGSTLLNNSNTFVRVGTGAVIGSTSEVVSGVATRGTEAFITTMVESDGDLGESLSAAKDSAFDGKQMIKDAALGGVRGGKDALTAPVGEKITQENADQLEKYADTKPERNPDMEKWLDNGGEIYVDANGKFTFVAPDGRKCVYEDGFPDFGREGYVEARYTTDGFDVSNHSADINLAKKNTGLGGKGSGSTWHHSPDGKTLELVPREIHEMFRHTGGFAVAKRGG